MQQRVAYFNGEWVADTGLSIPIGDPGFTLGVTVVERLRTFRRELFRVGDHIDRLRRSAEVVGLPVAAVDQVAHAVDEFTDRNRALMAEGDDWAVVAFLTPGPPGGEPTRCVHGFPLPFSGWAHQFAEGVPLRLVETRQVPPDCWPPELKCRSRMHYYLADQAARAVDPKSRALLLDQEGFVGEASTANVVAYYADRGLLTPRRGKVLPGVSQQVLFELADRLGIPTGEADLTPAEFAAADEAFLTSTSICLLPIPSLDGAPIGKACPGPVYRQLIEAWNDSVDVVIPAQAKAFNSR
ncbi:MAG: aminotransferase class IV [Planctomycetota bacterium]